MSNEIIKKAIANYMNGDVDFGAEHLGFKVLDKNWSDVVSAYKSLQEQTNGDDIIFINDLITNEDNEIVEGEMLDFDDCLDLIKFIPFSSGITVDEGLKEISKLCKIYRVMNLEENRLGKIKGTVLDFVW